MHSYVGTDIPTEVCTYTYVFRFTLHGIALQSIATRLRSNALHCTAVHSSASGAWVHACTHAYLTSKQVSGQLPWAFRSLALGKRREQATREETGT